MMPPRQTPSKSLGHGDVGRSSFLLQRLLGERARSRSLQTRVGASRLWRCELKLRRTCAGLFAGCPQESADRVVKVLKVGDGLGLTSLQDVVGKLGFVACKKLATQRRVCRPHHRVPWSQDLGLRRASDWWTQRRKVAGGGILSRPPPMIVGKHPQRSILVAGRIQPVSNSAIHWKRLRNASSRANGKHGAIAAT